MLSAVKMEGHEHPDWSTGGYYGETEVRALYTGGDLNAPTGTLLENMNSVSTDSLNLPPSEEEDQHLHYYYYYIIFNVFLTLFYSVLTHFNRHFTHK